MRELWDQKVGLAIVLVLATLAAARFLFAISLLPPGIAAKPFGLASASTHVLVDTPRSSAIDLREDTYSFTELTNRTLLLGNLMASPPVREYIARRSGVPAQSVIVSPPATIDQPRALPDSLRKPKSTDILKSPDEYRLSIQANPTVPILDVYSEAPTSQEALDLANGAVRGLRDYLSVLAASRSTPPSAQVRLKQLDRATGGSIAKGTSIQFAIVAFVLVFATASAAVLFIARVRRGWSASGDLTERPVGDAA